MPEPISTASVRETACPHCASQPGEPCREPSGRRALFTHQDRIVTYQQSLTVEEYRNRHAIPILTLTNDTQIKALMVQHSQPIELLDPKIEVEPGRGFRTHCVWAKGQQAFAVTRYQGYENSQDNGYVAIIVDLSDMEVAASIIRQFIETNQDPFGPAYACLERVCAEGN